MVVVVGSVSVCGAEVGGEISCTYAYDIFSILGYPNHIHMNGHMSRRQHLRANNLSSHDIFGIPGYPYVSMN